MEIFWSEEDAEHIRCRSRRYPNAVNVEPEWTQEVIRDPDAQWAEPDTKSVSGLGIRIIGYSPSAGFVITVTAFRERGRLRGTTAYKASGVDLRTYWEGKR